MNKTAYGVVVLAMGMLAACGQRSEFTECDGEVELRGGERLCVSDFEEVEPELEVESPDPMMMEAEPEQPTPHMEQPEPTEPEPTEPDPVEPKLDPVEPDPVEPDPEPEQKGYSTDSRGFPVARRAGDFKTIVHTASKACMIDALDDVYCWDLDFEDTSIRRPSWIEPIYEGASEVAVSDGSVCVIVKDRHHMECLAPDGTWKFVWSTRSQLSQISMMEYGGLACALDQYSQRPQCVALNEYDSSADFVSYEVSWLYPEDDDGRIGYLSFDMRNFNQSRGEYFATLDTDGVIRYRHGYSYMWHRDVKFSTENAVGFSEMFSDFGNITALAEGTIHQYSMYSRTGEPLELGAPSGRFAKLHSTQCAETPDRSVECWLRADSERGDVPGTWEIYREPRSISVRGGYTWCAISEQSAVECDFVNPDARR